MKIGTAKRVITPPVGVELSGFLCRLQPSTGVFDDLHLRVLVIENAGKRIAWIHCDLLGFSNETAAKFRKTAAKVSGISCGNIMLSATHTHSGPATAYLRNCGTPDPDYLKFLEKNLLGAIKEAAGAMEESVLSFAETKLDSISVDRRSPKSPYRHVDKRLPVLVFRRADGTYQAVIANFALHNVYLCGRMISGDIFGYAARYAELNLPGRPVVLISNGGCGNINPKDAIHTDYAGLARHGSILGDAILSTTHRARLQSNTKIDSISGELALPTRMFSPEFIEGKIAACRRNLKNKKAIRAVEALECWEKWFKEHKKKLALHPRGFTLPAHYHVIRIGDFKFAGINAEVFSRMAESLCRLSKDRNIFVVGYADGCFGYLPPAPIFKEGGYEPDEACIYYGTFPLKSGGFELVRDAVVKRLEFKL